MRQAICEDSPWIKQMHINFERLRGIKDADLREQMIIEWTRQIGRVQSEFTVLQRMTREDKIEVIGHENLQNISQPVIFVSCHLANWELVGHVLAPLSKPICALYAPPKNPVYHRVSMRARQDWVSNTELVAASPQAIFQLIRAINKGKHLLLFIDEEKDNYIWGPSLERKLPYAGNRWLAARLAVRHQVDIVPLYVERVGDSRYRVVIEPKLEQIDGDNESRAKDLADQLDHRLNCWVRERLEQWYWLSWLDLDKEMPS